MTGPFLDKEYVLYPGTVGDDWRLRLFKNGGDCWELAYEELVGGEWNLDAAGFLRFDCQHVAAGKCRIYPNRPTICRNYRCEALKGEQALGAMLLMAAGKPERPLRDVTKTVRAAMERLVKEAQRDGR